MTGAHMTQRLAMRRFVPIAIAALAVSLAVGVRAAAPPAEPESGGSMRRLTEQQYRNAIADIFGEDIQVAGRMDPVLRLPHELQVVGVSRIAVSPAGLEEYDRMAQAIAAQVVDEKHRATLVGCAPRDAKVFDEECAAKFFRRTGRFVFRRPLSIEDVRVQVGAANEAATLTKDFYKGLAVSLATMLISPKFVFDIDVLEPDPVRPGIKRLDAYTKATRLSLFLWNTTPDVALLEAAARGDLHTAKGLAKQVDRMLASPRLEAGVRAFFTDMLGFETIGDLAKDPVIYPQFVREVS